MFVILPTVNSYAQFSRDSGRPGNLEDSKREREILIKDIVSQKIKTITETLYITYNIGGKIERELADPVEHDSGIKTPWQHNDTIYSYDRNGNIISISTLKRNLSMIDSPDWKPPLVSYKFRTVTYDKVGNPIELVCCNTNF